MGTYWELKKPLPNEENQKVVNEYLKMLKNENWPESVIVTYRVILQSFFIEIEMSFSTVMKEDVDRWMMNKKKNSYQKKKTIYFAIVRSFFSYCLENGYIETQPIPDRRKKENGNNYWKIQIQIANKENEAVINDFLSSLKVANYSKSTIVAYRFYLENFFKMRQEDFISITSNQIQQWFIENEKGLKEKTICYHLTILSSFYNFCVEEGYVDKSPIKSRMYPRLPKPIPKYLDREEIANIRVKSENTWIRNRCILEFLISSGCRISELFQLDRLNVDLENRTAMVFGKGSKYRQVHFSEKCALLLERYLETRTDLNPALFVSSRKKVARLSKIRISSILQQLGEEANITGSLHAHRLRHTFATQMLSKGADLPFIADELGHSDVRTTQIYANLPKQKIISLYRRYMG